VVLTLILMTWKKTVSLSLVISLSSRIINNSLLMLDRLVELLMRPKAPGVSEALISSLLGRAVDAITNLAHENINIKTLVSISRNSMYALLQPRLDVLLFEIVFPLMCFSDNDQKLWEEDPHEYVRKGYDIIEDLYSPRTASMDFVSELVRKHGKENLHKFIQFIVEIFRRYDEAAIEFKPYRQKDGALLAIGALCDKLKQTEPYKSELERMLVQHVFPEFNSPVGHLRAKEAWVAGQYAHITFSDQNNFRKALQCVVSRMQDSELPVRVDSVFALHSFIEACKDLNEIRPILPQLLDDILVPLDNYISRGTAHFLTCKDPDYQQSLWNMVSSIMADKNKEDNDIVPAPKLIEVVFQNCRGRVDHWVEPYLRITIERLNRTEKSYLKCLFMQLIADALYYNAALTLSILQKLGVASEFFHLWFHLLGQVKKSGLRANFKREHEKKVCCLGLISLLALPTYQLPGEALGRVFRATLDLLISYKDQVAEAAKEEEAEDDDDMDGFQTDDEDENGNGPCSLTVANLRCDMSMFLVSILSMGTINRR
ncbi:hypothetical protein RYX36_010242, partial [Vicia faba]